MVCHLNDLLKQYDHPAIAGYSEDIHQTQNGSEGCVCAHGSAHIHKSPERVTG